MVLRRFGIFFLSVCMRIQGLESPTMININLAGMF